MKTPVAIVLILCGVLVIAIPALSHAWDSLMLAITLTHLSEPGSSASFMSIAENYQFGCYALGTAMIAVSVFASFFARPSDRPENARFAATAR